MQIIRFFVFLLSLFLVISCSDADRYSITDTGLVYCSEGSPDSFNPQVGTSLTSFDANARVLFNRLLKTDPETGDIKAIMKEILKRAK